MKQPLAGRVPVGVLYNTLFPKPLDRSLNALFVFRDQPVQATGNS